LDWRFFREYRRLVPCRSPNIQQPFLERRQPLHWVRNVMGKIWRIHPHDSERIASLERSARVPAVVAQLLVSRGVECPDEVRRFLDAKLSGLREPEDLPGLTDAADKIFAAATDARRIDIYGDYDADGMTATAILCRCLQMLGANVGYYVPHRIDEGYGLNARAIEKLAERGSQQIITVDCGIASVAEAETAKGLGLELIITDHHEMGPALPDAAALVHPRLPGFAYPFGGLCGAGVAFKLAWALCQRASDAKKVGERMRNFLLQAVGLAAIGTVADVVPLLDENRILVKHGLTSLKDRPTLGLRRLMSITKLDKKPLLDSEDIAFTLAPRLNAAGRLGQAQLAIELLITGDERRATDLATYIDQLNESRGSLERRIYRAANKQAKENFNPKEDAALVLAGRDWHPGVIGIVAGRLAEKYNRPVVLVALDQAAAKPGSGSARSAAGIDLHRALTACGEHLVGYGGHAAAAGLRIEEANIDRFRDEFREFVEKETTAEGRIAEVHIDAEAPLCQLTLKTVQQIEQLSPFGEGNHRPVLCTGGVSLNGPPKKIGGGERHLSVKLKQSDLTLRAVAFGQAEWAEELERQTAPFDIAYRPVINRFAGRMSVELQLVDWRPGNGK
jgi:single-stranded-DNA-specific exonuclease